MYEFVLGRVCILEGIQQQGNFCIRFPTFEEDEYFALKKKIISFMKDFDHFHFFQNFEF